jgi:HK97 family phage prohead protease
MEVERRGIGEIVELRVDGTPHVSGYAALYHAETEIAGLFREQIAPGAFRSAVDGTDDVRALFNHDPNLVLGRTKSGTLRLKTDAKGLRYDIDMPNTQAAQDVRELIKRGDVTGSSFGFTVDEDDWDDSDVKRGKLPLRTIRKVSLFDVSPVTYPAYPQTSVTARSKGEAAIEILRMHDVEAARIAIRDRMRARIQLERAWRA